MKPFSPNYMVYLCLLLVLPYCQHEAELKTQDNPPSVASLTTIDIPQTNKQRTGYQASGQLESSEPYGHGLPLGEHRHFFQAGKLERIDRYDSSGQLAGVQECDCNIAHCVQWDVSGTCFDQGH